MYDYEICKEEFDESGFCCIDVQELSFASTMEEAKKEQRRLRREYPDEIITIRQYKETEDEERHLVMVYD